MDVAAVAAELGLEREIAMLDELAEMGLDLARSVKALAQKQVTDALDGWTHQMPSDPGAAYARIVQCVRRTIALKVHLLSRGKGSTLFSEPRGLGLRIEPGEVRPPFPVKKEPADAEPAATVSQALSGDGLSGAAALRADLGSFLEPRENLFEIPRGDPHTRVGDQCMAFHLDPTRLKYQDGSWIVRADRNDPQSRDLPLRDWRPDPALFLDPPAPEPKGKPAGEGEGRNGADHPAKLSVCGDSTDSGGHPPPSAQGRDDPVPAHSGSHDESPGHAGPCERSRAPP